MEQISCYEEFRCLPVAQGQEDTPIFSGDQYTGGPLGTVAGKLFVILWGVLKFHL